MSNILCFKAAAERRGLRIPSSQTGRRTQSHYSAPRYNQPNRSVMHETFYDKRFFAALPDRDKPGSDIHVFYFPDTLRFPGAKPVEPIGYECMDADRFRETFSSVAMQFPRSLSRYFKDFAMKSRPADPFRCPALYSRSVHKVEKVTLPPGSILSDKRADSQISVHYLVYPAADANPEKMSSEQMFRHIGIIERDTGGRHPFCDSLDMA